VYSPTKEFTREDIQALVHAANSHADLLDALQWAADKLNDVAEWSQANCETLQARSVSAIEAKARVAIVRAEGQS
jgi:hypothetical protein